MRTVRKSIFKFRTRCVTDLVRTVQACGNGDSVGWAFANAARLQAVEAPRWCQGSDECGEGRDNREMGAGPIGVEAGIQDIRGRPEEDQW